jgi:hypothetical protein
MAVTNNQSSELNTNNNQNQTKQKPNNMKKILSLTLAASLVSASPLMALDLYITGSTAFRANVHDACLKLFDSVPTEHTGTAATGGDSKTGNAAAQWVMIGNVGTKVTALGNTTLTIHGLFTGSVQGIQTVEQSTPLFFLDADGVHIKTNTPTIAFTDVASSSTPFPATGNFSEEKVAVQPFVFVKAVGLGGLTNVTSITWEQLKNLVQIGRAPLYAWTHNPGDTNFVYLVNRTKDSGSRRTTFAEVLDGYNQAQVTYIYDFTNNFFYKATNTVNGSVGASQGLAQSVGVVGAPGNGNANLNWGSGYVGGGDIKTEMNYSNINNQAVSYLSISDAKGINGINWSEVISFNGVWPTAGLTGGSNISGNSGTNDYSPITLGQYPFWAYEVVVYPIVDPSGISGDQNLSASQLGDQTQSGTILGVLDAQSGGGVPLLGSIENEIEFSKFPANGPATAIRLSDMHASRQSVGGTITP